jgi:ribosomal protein L37AE/L43A
VGTALAPAATQKRSVGRARQLAASRAIRYCPSCNRGQIRKYRDGGDGRLIWTCRYCGHEISFNAA